MTRHTLGAAALLAFACACTLTTHAAEWTSFTARKLNAFSTAYAHLPDGRFVLGHGGVIQVQTTFGLPTSKTLPVASASVDPSFIAIKNATTGLIGAGGFGAMSAMLPFNPSAPTVAPSASINGLLNFAAVYWRHPTSGRSGWIIGGGNGTGGKHTLSYVSDSGTVSGAITGDLSAASGGLATDAQGNVYTGTWEAFGSAENDKVFKLTAAQVDAAVAAVIAAAPAPVPLASLALVHRFSGANSIAVDSFGRVWASGFDSKIERFDPVTSMVEELIPDHAPIVGAAGGIGYLLGTFARSGVEHISFMGSDSWGTADTAMMHGYRPVREVSFRTGTLSVSENALVQTITVDVSPAPSAPLTVSFAVSGSALHGADYSMPTRSLTFAAGETSKTFTVTPINDALDEPNDNEQLIIDLAVVAPAGVAAIRAAKKRFTLTLGDDDLKPQFAAQTVPMGRVGANYNYSLAMVTSGTVYTQVGLPAGMSIHRTTGVISGRPTVPGDYDKVVITATNSAGTTTSIVHLLDVEPYAAAAQGIFQGLIQRHASNNNLGGRFEITTTANASFSGKVTVGAAVLPFSGLLNTAPANPTGTAMAGANTVTFAIDAVTGAVTGTLGAMPLNGWATAKLATNTGIHNLGFTRVGPAVGEQPDGVCYATASVTGTGATTITGRMADGSVFTSSCRLGTSGELIILQVLYSNPGSVLGSPTLHGDAPRSVDGTLEWTKPAQTTPPAQPYKSGFTPMSLKVSGGKYRAPLGSTAALGLSGPYAAQLTMAGGNVESLTSALTQGLTVLPLAIAAPHRIAIIPSTGAFSGSFVAGMKTITFQGLIVPNTTTPDPFDGVGQGYFILDTAGTLRSGTVTLQAVP